MQPLIKLDNIYKTYKLDSRTFEVLKGIHFELNKGEMVSIMGSSGSGKSTLMNILGFLDRCTSGAYYFNGENVSDLSKDELAHIRNQKIGFVFQSFFLLPRFSALQNVMLPLFYRGVPDHVAKQQALDELEKVGMHTHAAHRPNQLSGGQQQRVAIARALVSNPEVILADEPTGALDTKTGNEVMQLLLRLNREEKRTIVIITHDKEISEQCRRVVMIRDGKLV